MLAKLLKLNVWYSWVFVANISVNSRNHYLTMLQLVANKAILSDAAQSTCRHDSFKQRHDPNVVQLAAITETCL